MTSRIKGESMSVTTRQDTVATPHGTVSYEGGIPVAYLRDASCSASDAIAWARQHAADKAVA
jgi:hypothetical protein